MVLCGHSYGGCVISGVVDRVPDRIGALVYLDAFVLEDGQSLHDTLPTSQRNLQLEAAVRDGKGWKVPPIPAEVFNVNAHDHAWPGDDACRGCCPGHRSARARRMSRGLRAGLRSSFTTWV